MEAHANLTKKTPTTLLSTHQARPTVLLIKQF